MENHLLFFHKKESWSINERCNKKLPVFEKPLLQLEAKKENMQFPIRMCQDCWKQKEMDHPSIHPSRGNPSQLSWIGKQDTSWIGQLSFKGLIHRDKHLHSQSHTVNLELAANLTSMSLDYERNPESHLTTPWGERTQSKWTLKSPRTFFL